MLREDALDCARAAATGRPDRITCDSSARRTPFVEVSVRSTDVSAARCTALDHVVAAMASRSAL